MSQKEIKRVTIISRVVEGQLKQGGAAGILGVTVRQIKRLVRKFRAEGAGGLVSRKRGKKGNHCHVAQVKAKAMELVQEKYTDFGPTFAAEKLREKEGLTVCKETLRQWMIEAGLWKAKRHQEATRHPRRERRSCFGELVQIDGSHHDWFEGRRDKCCLLVFIDDATSLLMSLRFEERETTQGYFNATRNYINKHGIPMAFYSDKFGVFRVNLPDVASGGETQFGRACRELEIELICANSPQAKGRVERANSTLQDRLIKEMRLRGINDIETANAFLENEFINDYNRRFAVQPRNSVDVHRKTLPDGKKMDLIFSVQSTRKLSKQLELSYENQTYQIKTKTKGYRLQHAVVTVCEKSDGSIAIVHQGKSLEWRRMKKDVRITPTAGIKEINKMIDNIEKVENRGGAKTIPSAQHPWRRPMTKSGKVLAQKFHAASTPASG